MSIKPKMLPELEESQSMTAMTDVVFQLLIFFIVTMGSYVQMTLLEAQMPTKSSKAQANVELSNIVRIDIPENTSRENIYIINGTAQPDYEVRKLLKRYGELMPDAELLIRCHPDSEHSQLVTLLSECSVNNLKKLKLIK